MLNINVVLNEESMFLRNTVHLYIVSHVITQGYDI